MLPSFLQSYNVFQHLGASKGCGFVLFDVRALISNPMGLSK